MRQRSTIGIGRTLLYVLSFPAILALDTITPLGLADWLLEVLLVWIASLAGMRREVRAVAAISTGIMLIGLWTSPATVMPLWMGALNRIAAIAVICAMVNAADRRISAEISEQAAESQLKVLQGLLPICSVCKSIRDAGGKWHKLETYLVANSEAQLTHSYCPACAEAYMTELQRELPSL